MATAILAGTCPEHPASLCVLAGGAHHTRSEAELRTLPAETASRWLQQECGEPDAVVVIEPASRLPGRSLEYTIELRPA